MMHKIPPEVTENAKVVTEAMDWTYPAIAKSISGGYDGRGVWKVNSKEALSDLLKEHKKLLLEELIEFEIGRAHV